MNAVTMIFTKHAFLAVNLSIIFPIGTPERAWPNPIAIKAYRALAKARLLDIVGSSASFYALIKGVSIPDQ